MTNLNQFNNGIKINNDLNNSKEGPHYDVMLDFRNPFRTVDKFRISPTGDISSGETMFGPMKSPWNPK